MLNRYPLWKYILIICILIFGFIYALPNLYPDDPAIQISSRNSSATLSSTEVNKIQNLLEINNIPFKSVKKENKNFLIRLKDLSHQQIAKSLVKNHFGDNYIVALNLAPTTPNWLTSIGAYPMRLGLDLSGGVHFLLNVDTQRVISQKLQTSNHDVKSLLRKNHLRYKSMPDDQITKFKQIYLSSENTRNQAKSLIIKEFDNLTIDTKNENERFILTFGFNPSVITKIEDDAVRQNLVSIRNRVDELGVSEPLVQRQGRNNIVVELPGIQDTAEAKRILGKTANLEFRLQALPDTPASQTQSFIFDRSNHEVKLNREIIVTGDQVSGANSSFDAETNQPQVNIKLDSTGGKKMNNVTRSSIGRSMAVLFIEQKPITTTTEETVHGTLIKKTINSFREERRIISLATIQSALGNQFRITGIGSSKDASDLALLLRSGSLAAPMYFEEERTIGPSLGAENINMGIDSTLIGLIFIALFMMVAYRTFGFIANIALTINLFLLVAIMSLFGATLTMPGIAGIVLTLGMAVDANVLIFSRIREEINAGRSIQKAIFDGYDRAFVSIFDGNITTLIVGILLFAVGTGPVKGFAVTLSIGIITSMFTAIMLTRALVNIFYGKRRHLKSISI